MPDSAPEATLRTAAEEAVRAAEARVRTACGIDLPPAELDFSLRGRCAGQARVDPDGATLLRFNLKLLAENRADFLAVTIPHEIAHLAVLWPVRRRRRRPRPHGPEWQAVMREVFGLPPQRCHDYATSPARVVPRPFRYACACDEHRLTRLLHERIRHAGGATCRRCRSELRLLPQVGEQV